MNKALLVLSSVLLVGFSACDFFCKKETKAAAVEQSPAAPVAENEVGQEVAMNDAVATEVVAEEGAKEEAAAVVTEAPAPEAEVVTSEVVVEEAPVATEVSADVAASENK